MFFQQITHTWGLSFHISAKISFSQDFFLLLLRLSVTFLGKSILLKVKFLFKCFFRYCRQTYHMFVMLFHFFPNITFCFIKCFSKSRIKFIRYTISVFCFIPVHLIITFLRKYVWWFIFFHIISYVYQELKDCF